MARERVYTVSFRQITISAVQDLISLYAGANMACSIHTIDLGQSSQQTVGAANIRLRHLPATVTPGSLGSATTPRSNLPNDAAATSTARINDTTQATTSGTALDTPDVWNLLNGYLYLPPDEDRIVIKPNEAFIVSLDTVFASVVCSGFMTYGELF